MKIDEKLNLVLTVETANGDVHVYAQPLSREVFERYYKILGISFTQIWEEGLHVTAGPKLAALMLREIAIERKIWEGADGVEQGLMEEIRRKTTVACPTPEGWQQLPLASAVAREVITADDQGEVENIVTFFILECAFRRKTTLRTFLSGLEYLYDARLTSSSFTEWLASLPRSTGEKSTTSAVRLSSVPS